MKNPIVWIAAVLCLLAPLDAWAACPFCTPVDATLSERFKTKEVVALARLLDPPQELDQFDLTPRQADFADETGLRPRFEITEVLQGEKYIQVGQQPRIFFPTKANVGDSFLLFAAAAKAAPTNSASLLWSEPKPVDAEDIEYIHAHRELPTDPRQRLAFFIKHLEASSALAAGDAYDELAITPYVDVVRLQDQLDRKRLRAWILDEETPKSRLGLYVTLLGIVAAEENLQLLERLVRKEIQLGSGFDAAAAAFLKLQGTAGLDVLDELYLANPESDYLDTYKSIQAIRFMGEEEPERIPRERLLESLRKVLSRPNLADLVLPDLARWEDWSAVDEVMAVVRDKKQGVLMREPAAHYLLVNPTPEAAAALEELEEIAPQAVARARRYADYEVPETISASGAGSAEAPRAGNTVTAAKPPESRTDLGWSVPLIAGLATVAAVVAVIGMLLLRRSQV